jgi:hypothetical protein
LILSRVRSLSNTDGAALAAPVRLHLLTAIQLQLFEWRAVVTTPQVPIFSIVVVTFLFLRNVIRCAWGNLNVCLTLAVFRVCLGTVTLLRACSEFFTFSLDISSLWRNFRKGKLCDSSFFWNSVPVRKVLALMISRVRCSVHHKRRCFCSWCPFALTLVF